VILLTRDGEELKPTKIYEIIGGRGNSVQNFIGEDDLTTFEGWLRYRGADAAAAPEDLMEWRSLFEETRKRSSGTPKVGMMKLKPRTAGERRYAVAVREGVDLWLVLWVKRSQKGEFFVLVPRGDPSWNFHTSYHLDGTLHMKTCGNRVLPPRKAQPLTGVFRGTENLGAFAGYGPKSVEAICNPSAFSGVVDVASGILGPRDGPITVDLVEPDCEPAPFPWTGIARREVFRDTIPWVVITIGSCQ
jgi:hypothetical protein